MKKLVLGSKLAIKLDGDIAVPHLTLIDQENEEIYTADYKTAWVLSHGYVILTNALAYEECETNDPRVISVYAQIVNGFAEWFKRGGSKPDPVPNGKEVSMDVLSAEEAQALLAKMNIPSEPVREPTGNPYDVISAATGLPKDCTFDDWRGIVQNVEEVVARVKGPLIELCDGRYVRSADLTEEDKNLIADPHDSPHNAAVLGGDSYRDGKWVFQDRPPEEA